LLSATPIYVLCSESDQILYPNKTTYNYILYPLPLNLFIFMADITECQDNSRMSRELWQWLISIGKANEIQFQAEEGIFFSLLPIQWIS
jgi:hypothetical protein